MTITDTASKATLRNEVCDLIYAEGLTSVEWADRIIALCRPTPKPEYPHPWGQAEEALYAGGHIDAEGNMTPQPDAVEKIREALEFYSRQWQGNADGAMDGTPGLTRTWQEPTDALWDDAGRKAEEALVLLPTLAPTREAVVVEAIESAICIHFDEYPAWSKKSLARAIAAVTSRPAMTQEMTERTVDLSQVRAGLVRGIETGNWSMVKTALAALEKEIGQ